MEIKQKEIINYKNVYVAVDGMEFTDEAQCRAYENSAKGLLNILLHEMSVCGTTEDEVFNCGSCDNTVTVVIPKTKDDINKIRQFLLVHNCSENHAAGLTEEHIGKIVIITVGYDGDGAWFDTLEGIASRVLPDYDVKISYKKKAKTQE